MTTLPAAPPLDEPDNVFKRRRVAERSAENAKETNAPICAICHDDPSVDSDADSDDKVEEERVRIETDCGHTFCVRCLMKWANTNAPNTSCPTCRANLTTQIGTIVRMMENDERDELPSHLSRAIYDLIPKKSGDAMTFNCDKSLKLYEAYSYLLDSVMHDDVDETPHILCAVVRKATPHVWKVECAFVKKLMALGDAIVETVATSGAEELPDAFRSVLWGLDAAFNCGFALDDKIVREKKEKFVERVCKGILTEEEAKAARPSDVLKPLRVHARLIRWLGVVGHMNLEHHHKDVSGLIVAVLGNIIRCDAAARIDRSWSNEAWRDVVSCGLNGLVLIGHLKRACLEPLDVEWDGLMQVLIYVVTVSPETRTSLFEMGLEDVAKGWLRKDDPRMARSCTLQLLKRIIGNDAKRKEYYRGFMEARGVSTSARYQILGE